MVTCSIPGGKAPVRDATEEVKEIALAVKAEVEAKVNQTFAVYEAVKYRSQVVAGVNYYIKVTMLRIYLLSSLACNNA